MSEQTSVEQRLAALEAEVAGLRQRVEQLPSRGNWLEGVVGSMEQQPAFEEAMRLARELRAADRLTNGD